MSTKLSEYIGNRDNNFNLIRFIAASLVIVSHSYPIVLGTGHWDPFRGISGGLTLGTLAVDIFFITSGFLITSSLLSGKNIIAFCWARFLRIYPALIVAVLFCVLVVGVWFTTVPIKEYLTDTNVWLLVLKNISLIWKLGYDLPGVFESNPYPNTINGSLWTLPWEVRMYGLLAIFWLFFKSRLPLALTLLVLVSIVLLLVLKTNYSPELKNIYNLFRFITFFFFGSLFFIFKENILFNSKVFIILILSLLFSIFINPLLFYFLYTFSLAYIILYLAYVPAGSIRKYNMLGDYSYGIYIYAFPVQQSIIAIYTDVSVWEMIWMTWLVTLILAVFSWTYVEKIFLHKKDSYKILENKLVELNLVSKRSN